MTVTDTEDVASENSGSKTEQKSKKIKRRIRFASELEHHQFPKSFWDDAEAITRGKILALT